MADLRRGLGWRVQDRVGKKICRGSVVDVGELINFGYLLFRQAAGTERPALFSPFHFLSFFQKKEGGRSYEGTDFSNRSAGRIPSAARGIQVESTRVLRVRRLVVNLSPLRPLHSLEFFAGRVDRMERGHLVS